MANAQKPTTNLKPSQSPRRNQAHHQVDEILDFLNEEEPKPLPKVGVSGPSNPQFSTGSLAVPIPDNDPRRRSNTMHIQKRVPPPLEPGELPREDYVRRYLFLMDFLSTS